MAIEAGAVADEHALYARLLDHDPLASSDLANAYLPPLVAYLETRFPAVDAHTLQDVAIDLLLGLAERPRQFRPGKASLSVYLRMAAYRDVQNARRSAARRARHYVPLEAVELSPATGNIPVDSMPDPAETALPVQALSPHLTAALQAAFTPHEWRIVELMLDGERHTAVFASHLGLMHLPELQQAREVKRVKDRLQKRLTRLRAKLPPPDLADG